MEDKKLEQIVREKPKIDPSIPWNEEHNLNVAKKLGVRYDIKRRVYRDNDGCPVLDKYGQSLG